MPNKASLPTTHAMTRNHNLARAMSGPNPGSPAAKACTRRGLLCGMLAALSVAAIGAAPQVRARRGLMLSGHYLASGGFRSMCNTFHRRWGWAGFGFNAETGSPRKASRFADIFVENGNFPQILPPHERCEDLDVGLDSGRACLLVEIPQNFESAQKCAGRLEADRRFEFASNKAEHCFTTDMEADIFKGTFEEVDAISMNVDGGVDSLKVLTRNLHEQFLSAGVCGNPSMTEAGGVHNLASGGRA